MIKQDQIYDKIVLADEIYKIEPLLNCMVNTADRSKVLAYADMKHHKGYYSFILNWQTNRIEKHPDKNWKHYKRTYQKIVIPEGVARLQVNDRVDEFNRQSYERNYGFALLGPLYYQRVAAPKVLVNIANEIYQVNHPEFSLERIFSPYQTIHLLKELSLRDVKHKVKQVLDGLYNYKTLEVLPLPKNTNRYPENTVRITLNLPWQIDPVGSAIAGGHKPYAYLVNSPLQREYKALLSFDSKVSEQKYIEHCKARGQNKQADIKLAEHQKKRNRSIKR